MKKNKIDVIEGHGTFVDAHTLRVTPSEFKPAAQEQRVTAAHFVVATGARACSLPGTPIDGDRILQYRERCDARRSAPRMIVVWLRRHWHGVQLCLQHLRCRGDGDRNARPAAALEDAEVSAEVQKAFHKRGIHDTHQHPHQKIVVGSDGVTVTVRNLKSNEEQTLQADRVLMAIGVHPNTDQLGLAAAGGELDGAVLSKSTSACAPTSPISMRLATAPASWRWPMSPVPWRWWPPQVLPGCRPSRSRLPLPLHAACDLL
jgi:dihydrolipoamide dehydrogenase